MSERRRVRVGDVAREVTVGHVGSMAAEYVESGVPFLRSLNVRPHRVEMADVKYVNRVFHERLRKSALVPGDVVTVRTGKPGQTAVIPEWLGESNCADLVITRVGPELDARWLSYYINSIADSYIAGNLVGAVQQHFNVRAVESIELDLPGIAEQRAVAEVLCALDDKIATNTEVAGRADLLASSYFSAAAATTSLSARLVDVSTLILGGTPSRANHDFWTGGTVAWVASGKANDKRILEPTAWITEEALARSAAKMMPARASVVAITGATLGKVARLEIEASGNQSLVGFWCDDPSVNDWLHFAVRDRIQILLRDATGAAQQHVNKRAVENLEVPMLGEVAVRRWGTTVRPLLDRAAQADRESAALGRTRAELLPLLMSGRIRVKDAEKVVEGAL